MLYNFIQPNNVDTVRIKNKNLANGFLNLILSKFPSIVTLDISGCEPLKSERYISKDISAILDKAWRLRILIIKDMGMISRHHLKSILNLIVSDNFIKGSMDNIHEL
jgi:hypothetical protein